MIYSGFHYDSAVCINHIPSNIEVVIRGRSLHKCKNVALHIIKNKLYAMEHIDKLIFNRYDYILCDDMQYPNELDEYRYRGVHGNLMTIKSLKSARTL